MLNNHAACAVSRATLGSSNPASQPPKRSRKKWSSTAIPYPEPLRGAACAVLWVALADCPPTDDRKTRTGKSGCATENLAYSRTNSRKWLATAGSLKLETRNQDLARPRVEEISGSTRGLYGSISRHGGLALWHRNAGPYRKIVPPVDSYSCSERVLAFRIRSWPHKKAPTLR